MAFKSDSINDNVDKNFSSPQRTRPTDRQMGLGTHNLIQDRDKAEDIKRKKSDT